MKYKLIKYKLLSLLLVLSLLFTVMPMKVFALEAEPLTLIAAEVTNGGGVGLTFNKGLSPTDFVNKIKAGFTIMGLEETPKTITDATLHSASGGTNNFVQLYLNPTVKGGEVASVSYTPSGVQSLEGGMLAEILSMDITNYAPHPDLVTTAPPTATVGTAYTHTLTASGGTGPYTFTVDGGNLPSGLTMSSTGVISGTPTVAASFTFFIMVRDADEALDIEGFNITVSSPVVNICEIGGTRYTTLDAALASIGTGETKTIILLKNIDYDKCVSFNNKKVTFALNGYTLNINNPAEGGVGLDVQSGGSVSLTGSGALKVTGKAYGVRVTTNVLQTSATVTSATATGTEGRAAYAAGPASITVLEDATVTGISGYGLHAISGGRIAVKGNVNATNEGIYASDSSITVDGNVVASGTDLLGGATGIGAGVYGRNGAVKIGGNVTANRVGAMARAGGSITIDGILTAPDYIQFADDAPTAIEDYLATTTKTGYRTYQHSTAGTVWLKGEMLITTYDLNVVNGTGNGSYAKDEVVTITANPAHLGQKFKEWSITPSVTFADGTNKNSQTAKFIMPAQSVTATAVYEASIYTITVQNDGKGSAGANFSSAAEGAEITLTAAPNSGYRFKEWQVLSGSVTIANNKFHMLDSNVVVKAIFEPIPTYAVTITGGTGGGNYVENATVSITANAAPSGKEFHMWTTSDGVTIADVNAVSTSFIMPAKAVTVTATYKDLPPETIAGNVQNQDNETANANATTSKSVQTITLTHKSGNAVATKEVAVKNPDAVLQYKIIKGANSSWKNGTTAEIEITSDGDFSKFTGLKVDGILLGTEHYTAVPGSTVITLKAAFIKTLTLGTHTVEFVYEDSSVQTEITILAADQPTDSTNEAKPTSAQVQDTGKNSHVAIWIALFFVSVGAVTLLVVMGLKRKSTK